MRVPAGVAGVLAEAVARPLAASWRWSRLEGPDRDVPSRDRPPFSLDPAVYALWHEHLLPLALAHRGAGVTALVSQHRDGEILTRVLGRLGHQAARGSSTRGGSEGLEAMIRAGREGHPLAFTPDGPQGPARRCKPGVLQAAAATGLPIVPLAASSSRGRRLASWDRFLIPAPFARVVVSRGAPLEVPAELAASGEDGVLGEGDGLRSWTARVEEAIEHERHRCERALGRAVT